MKFNILKYAFILFVLAIIGFAIYKINSKEEIQAEQKNETIVQTQVTTNIRLGISNFDNINPIISKNRDIINLSTIIYEPLLTLSKDYKLELGLAKEYSKVNDKTYIVTLKSDLEWEDGTPITGQDVKFTIEKLKEGKSIYSDNVKNISSVEIIDIYMVRINLLEQENFFEYNLVFPIISYSQFYREKDFYASRIAPMASGMYKVKSANTDMLQLVKNEKWYGTPNTERKIDNIQIKFYKNMGDVYNSFKIGNIDTICTSNTKIKDYIGTIGFTSKEYKGRELDFIALNCKGTILSNKEVRQAINYAIDKKKIISSVFNNEYYISSFPIDYGNYLYNKESKSSYNKDKAKEVLKKAGWTYKYGIWQKTENYNTKTIRLKLVVDSSNKTRVKVAKLIESQLEDIGIQVSLYEISNSNYKDYLKEKSYDMIITGVNNGYSPDITYFMGENNISNYKNSEVTNILNDLKNISDENLMKEKYNKLIEIYESDVPSICLYRNKLKVVYSMKMIGDFTPNNYTSYYNFQKWYRQ